MKTGAQNSTDTGPSGNSPIWRWLLFAVLVIVVAVRLPFLGNTLVGEEGSFALMAVDDGSPSGTEFGQLAVIARLKGKNITIRPEHPILPYVFLTNVWRPFWGQAAT